MPGLNLTGPMGQGPMTGRGLGRCADAKRQVDVTKQDPIDEQDAPIVGTRGFGMGRACGRRWLGMGRQARFGGRR
ncbi:MAG: DUF5320 domain-containing protein [Bacteroidales bacterium]|nr:DUF5320 domain-containing protein [Bacteroidales bacterium]